MKKLSKQQVDSLKKKSVKRGYTCIEMKTLKLLKVGEGISMKLPKYYNESFKNRWYEYATRLGIKVKIFSTFDLLLVIQRVK